MIENYMSWEGGVDLVGLCNCALEPNVIIHIARMVHTPVGSAPAGMILLQTDPNGAPELMGFVSPDAEVGGYFGPKIFGGTPFENAPVLDARISVSEDAGALTATIEVEGFQIVCSLSSFGKLAAVDRNPGEMTPFFQQVLEAESNFATVTVDGNPLEVTIPEKGLSGGSGAVSTPAGIYSR